MKAIAKVKKEDPANMKAIIQDIFIAPNNDLPKNSLLNFFENKINANAPKTPREAASVAVAIPA